MLSNFISTSIIYKKQQIGILRAIGARSSDVFRIFFSESFVIAMINFVLSATGTLIAVTLINYFIRSETGILITILTFSVRQVLLLFLVSLLVAAASVLFSLLVVAVVAAAAWASQKFRKKKLTAVPIILISACLGIAATVLRQF